MQFKPVVDVYEPNKFIKQGIWTVWKNIFNELLASRELGHRLFKRDLSAKYKQSLLGVCWIIITPLFTTGVFIALNMAGILNIESSGVPYPIFAVVGSIIWSLLFGLITSMTTAVSLSASLLSKINFQRVSLLHSPILTSVLDFAMRTVLIALAMLLFKTTPSLIGVILFPFALIPLVLFSIGIGLFLSVVGSVIKDVINATTMILNLLLYATPILYPLPKSGMLRKISELNPFFHLVSVPRDLFFYGRADNIGIYLGFAVFSVVLLLLGLRFYHLALSKIVEKI